MRRFWIASKPVRSAPEIREKVPFCDDSPTDTRREVYCAEDLRNRKWMILDAHQTHVRRTSEPPSSRQQSHAAAAAAETERDAETGKIAIIAGSCWCAVEMPHTTATDHVLRLAHYWLNSLSRNQFRDRRRARPEKLLPFCNGCLQQQSLITWKQR